MSFVYLINSSTNPANVLVIVVEKLYRAQAEKGRLSTPPGLLEFYFADLFTTGTRLVWLSFFVIVQQVDAVRICGHILDLRNRWENTLASRFI